eukprot:Trichotokara_eunicae@DN4408_c0_g1_i1.p2
MKFVHTIVGVTGALAVGNSAGGAPPKVVPPNVGRRLSDQEIAEADEDFAEFDQNKDGLIDAHEVRQQKDPEADIFAFFREVDTDDSGTVSRLEYYRYLMRQ